jgi:dihydroorotate dehydrogenase electron transfer subunit
LPQMSEVTSRKSLMPRRIFQVKAKVIKNIEVIKNYYKIVILCPGIAKAAQPGQFLQVKVNNSDQPLLRRPFGIHRVRGAQIEMLYEVVGPGTEILAKRKSGEYLDIIGPLGNGFEPDNDASGSVGCAILVAGGMGIAPLVFLAEKLKGRQTVVLIGARTKKQLLCESELKKLGCEVRVATDDGSKGLKGKVTELLRRALLSADHRQATVYACGPRPMLKEISRLAKKYNLPAQVSLEEHMACGIGACLGCVVETIDGYKRVCKEGPVFDVRNIAWGVENK